MKSVSLRAQPGPPPICLDVLRSFDVRSLSAAGMSLFRTLVQQSTSDCDHRLHIVHRNFLRREASQEPQGDHRRPRVRISHSAKSGSCGNGGVDPHHNLPGTLRSVVTTFSHRTQQLSHNPWPTAVTSFERMTTGTDSSISAIQDTLSARPGLGCLDPRHRAIPLQIPGLGSRG